MNYKSIIVGSAPRTGGMWTYNVVREIFINLEKKIIPLNIPQDDDQMLDCHFINLKNRNDIISIIKIHKLIKKEYANKTKILINIRDPRDAVISYKRFMKLKNYSFQQAINFIKNSINRIWHYRENFDKENLLEINFKDIVNNPRKIFFQLEKFLNLEINKKIVDQIIKKFSKKKISEMIKKKEIFIKKKIKKKQKIYKQNLLIFDKNNIRIFDEKTGFQTGHISNYKDGEWKQHFSNNEISIINNRFKKWFLSNNFSL